MDQSDSSISGQGARQDDAIKTRYLIRNSDSEDSDEGNGNSAESIQHDTNLPNSSDVSNGGDDDETSSESDDELLGEKQKSAGRHPGKVLLTHKKVSLISKANGGLISSKTSSEAGANGSNHPPKTRIKLSLKLPMTKNVQAKRNLTVVKKMKLPMSKNHDPKATGSALDDDSGVEEEVNEVQATVVDSDEAEEVDVVATAVQDDPPDSLSLNASAARLKSVTTSRSSNEGHDSTKKKASALVSTSAKSGFGSTKRRSFHPSRQIRLPPIPSPGLLIPPPSSSQGGQKNINPIKVNGVNLCAPRELFDSFMELAGYTLEKRSHRPHRGSSVRRTVGDMFDSNVTLSLHFPELIPTCVVASCEEQPESQSGAIGSSQPLDTVKSLKRNRSESVNDPFVVAYQLIRGMEKVTHSDCSEMNTSTTKGRDIPLPSSSKRKRPLNFTDMVPVSLTLPFPEDYIRKQAEYVRAVKRREELIIEWQEEQINIEIAAEDGEASEAGTEFSDKQSMSSKNTVTVPPIPLPPEPPKIEDLVGFEDSGKYMNDLHPIYLPAGKTSLVGHLDRSCFHITDGRYFGLSSNFVADPNFVGANAPGVATLSASAGTGLATSTLGSGSGSGVMSITLSGSVHGGDGASLAKSKPLSGEAETIKSNGKSATAKAVANITKASKTQSSDSKLSSKKVASTSSSSKKFTQKPTASSANLRKLMEDGGPTTDSFRKCIVRAAVHASRTGKQGPSFRGPDGETYPDVSKAFSAHAGIKPCQRCKSNKQGVYHCRLRRRHDDPDYDGGSSASCLIPLFKVPLESLID